MKRIFTSLFILLAIVLCNAFTAFAKPDVQALAVGRNVLVGGPARIVAIEAVGASATGSITVKRVIDTWTYSTASATVTNSFTNAVAWTTQAATNRVITFTDNWQTITNAVYTNVVRGVTNRVYDIRRIESGVLCATNSVIVTNPVWTTSFAPFVMSSVTNDVISHAVYTNSVGTITLSNHVGTLAPTNLYFTGGDVILIESANDATLRLYSEGD